MAANNHDNYTGQEKGLSAESSSFVTVTPADSDLAVIPKRVIINVTTAGGSVVLKDRDLNSSTVTLPLGMWELKIRPRRVVSATNATVLLVY